MTHVEERRRAEAVLQSVLEGSGLAWERSDAGDYVVSLPGERKLRTTCAFTVGAHGMAVNAFVARRPDENHEAVYRWLLERNARTYAVAFALDRHGDIYLTGRVPLHAVTADEVDRLLGAVLEYADGSFNTILEKGFATAIRKEWEWRTRRGEPTANLAAFAHLAEPPH